MYEVRLQHVQLVPVSYTHLDVYKRQVLLWLAECEVELNKLALAEEHVNMLRNRAKNGSKQDATVNNKVEPYPAGTFAAQGADYARNAVRMEQRLEDVYKRQAFNIIKANKEGTNWQDVIFDPAPIANYQLGASGGTQNGKFSISANYFKQDGILRYTQYDRYSVRANTEFKRGKLTIGENFTYAYDERQGIANNNESNPIMFAIRVHPIIPVFDITGGPVELGGTNASPYNGFAGSRGVNLGNAPNPLARLYREDVYKRQVPIPIYFP